MQRLITAVMFCVLAGLPVPDGSAQEPAARTLAVAGEGSVSAAPDMAAVRTGVVSTAPTAAAALEANSRDMSKIMAVLETRAVAEKDVQTTVFEVAPQYRHDERGRTRPEIVGYQVRNQITVQVRRLDDLGAILDALVRAGANRMDGIVFSIDRPESLQSEARRRAVADARRRAAEYAEAAGVALGRVVSIREQDRGHVRPPVLGRAYAAEAAGVPVAAGELDFTAAVHMVFDIADP